MTKKILNKRNIYIILICIYAITIFVAFYFEKQNKEKINNLDFQQLKDNVLPNNGFTLPINWENLGKKMVDRGVIDSDKLSDIYKSRGGLTDEMNKLLYNDSSEQIVINKNNAGFWLNLFWGLGLSNKNSILENGSMMQDGNASKFASTGGWTISSSQPMEYYSKFNFISLDDNQQRMVEEISKNIYRPCCNNSTYFPDCNHGMAMLGLIELMASQNISEKEIYNVALKVNSYWFPDTYLTIAKYFQDRGIDWKNINSKEILGKKYSSLSGYQEIRSKVILPITTAAACSI